MITLLLTCSPAAQSKIPMLAHFLQDWLLCILPTCLGEEFETDLSKKKKSVGW